MRLPWVNKFSIINLCGDEDIFSLDGPVVDLGLDSATDPLLAGIGVRCIDVMVSTCDGRLDGVTHLSRLRLPLQQRKEKKRKLFTPVALERSLCLH